MRFKKWLIGSGLAKEYEIKGMTDVEISTLEQKNSITFPDDYTDFLRQCSRSAGLFAKDIRLFYPDFLFVGEIFEEVFEDSGIAYRPPASAFFFSEYQGGYFHYFLCDDSDRRIYVINEQDVGPSVGYNSFTSFVLTCISGYQDALFENPDKSWMQL